MPIHLPKDPPLVEVPTSQVLWRVHFLAYGPVWFGPAPGDAPRGRFDAPGGEFGVCYFGSSLGVALLETLVRGRKVPIIPRAELELRGVSAVEVKAPLRMLQVEGKGLPGFGISAHEVCGDDCAPCRDLALRAYRAMPDVDGIQYRSRWDTSELCWAVFDRARDRLGDVLGTQRLDDPAVVRPALLPYRHVGVL
ncbi:RES family NAD+ phosphorylase [Longimicrobium sp.]|uniref:RES family NAD+ phosphorylase n=1 Tax=Longimicrobium sp. TaxID=2029185 RepID=UPI002E36A7F7|nr:RES family NAD+ phosphorylase [Longimicrobium sp.]HEX6040265.1 RES family NAD+ phosphorylase [Longimicrobium sp.]